MTDVKGKWALVTGANRGIGYRIAKFLAGKGCNLILHSRSLEHTAAVLAEVRAMGVEAYDVAAELSDLSQVQKMIDEINAKVKPKTFLLIFLKLYKIQQILHIKGKIFTMIYY